MPQNPTTPLAPGSLDLPNFGDRLPDLSVALRQAGRDLEFAAANQSYIPYFEDVYATAHNLKGVTRILACPKPMEDFIFSLNSELARALSGSSVCRKNSAAGKVFLSMAEELDREMPLEARDYEKLQMILDQLSALYTEDQAHEDRLTNIPTHLFYVNEFVSKKAREITLLNLNDIVVEDEARLDEIPFWRTQLNEALLSSEFGRGIVINFLPFLSSEGSRSLKLWAWIAAASHSRASLKQRIKEVMPKVKITKT